MRLIQINLKHCEAAQGLLSQTIRELNVDVAVICEPVRSPKIIAGDFNAWALDWGSRMTNTRGQILLETFAELSIVLANVGCVPTFRGRGLGSIVYLTYLSTSLARVVERERRQSSEHPKRKKQDSWVVYWSFRGRDNPGGFRRLRPEGNGSGKSEPVMSTDN
ncbi:unnamed protein product [Hermetia illucens]|uniref:Endonuclease/exonuclease/phosphatase domain-containing protein n=1 Tax=Hermetia illucens TaxID=343691 RepID=A0A7R8V1I7_HERIL|nr:unnamed protein product [Hermetia illucens]